ncbi:uncharacterized protein LOC135469689 [Liolophura sinensis]|uniref:uncharacterized protein LOC135469689 n=1 Tax=Liolophura sinensis TaxID=3198878 RepID=UPI003158CC63
MESSYTKRIPISVCQPGSWGDNCARTCSEYCLEQPCNAQTGACEGGCQPGYAGKFCESELKVTVNPVDYTGVIIGCVVGVILAAALITAVVLYVRRRQSGQPQASAVSSVSTSVTLHVPHSEVPNCTLEPGTDPVTYYNMVADEEHPYETVPEKEYDKVRFSRLETDTNSTSLT